MIQQRIDQPDLKCVQRSEIASQFSSAKASALDAASREQLEKSYYKLRDWCVNENELVTKPGAARGDVIVEPSEDVFQFRLFSKKSSSVPVAQRVVLRSPTPTNQNPGFLVPSRPDSYYFTNGSSIEKIQQYQQAAVTGDDILKGLNGKWYGSKLPWRVTTVQPSGSSIKLSDPWSTAEDETSHRKKRIGKRRRIAIRKKTAIQLKVARSKSEIEAARKEKRARTNSDKRAKKAAIKEAMGLSPGMSKAEKETALKEKRTRRNREKKVKKKVRDRLKKTSVTNQPPEREVTKLDQNLGRSRDCMFGYTRTTQNEVP